MPKSPEKPHPGAAEKAEKAERRGQKATGRDARKAPPMPVNTGNTRVNFAFPFSKIEVLEPSNEMIEMAKLMSELVTSLAGVVPEDTLADLRAKTDALLARLTS